MLDSKKTVVSNICLEKISVSIYSTKPYNFQTIIWANSRMFNYLLGAQEDSFKEELVSEGFVGRGAKATHLCAAPLLQGFCLAQEQYKCVVYL